MNLDGVSQKQTHYQWKQHIVSSLNIKSNHAMSTFAYFQQWKRWWPYYWHLNVPILLHSLQNLYGSTAPNTIKILEIVSFLKE